MYAINPKLFEQKVSELKLAYLLIRASIEHLCSTDQNPTHEMTEHREFLVTSQLANRVGSFDKTEATTPNDDGIDTN